MESDSSTIVLAFLVGLALIVIVGPPVLLAVYRWIRHGYGHGRGHRSHRSSHREDD